MNDILDEKEKERQSIPLYKFAEEEEEFSFNSCVVLPVMFLVFFLLLIGVLGVFLDFLS